MPPFGIPGSAYEFNSDGRLMIRFDREIFNNSLLENEIEVGQTTISNNMGFRFSRNDLFRPSQ